jgi:amino acid adenylation domain-containing protein
MKKNLIEYFEKTSKIYPDRIAVTSGDKSIDFKQLRLNARSLAMHLLTMKFSSEANRPIAVFLQKDISSITSDLAIIYSGNFYMNLDIKLPKLRILNIIKQIKPALIITDNNNLHKLKEINDYCDILNIDELDIEISISNDIIESRLDKLIDTDPLCIINTSGSTGTPKGVVLNHRSFIDFTEWAINTLKIGDAEIIGSLSPLVFDIYSFELCMLMSKGSSIVIIPDSLAAFPAAILNVLNDNEVTFIFWVPTIMVNIANLDLFKKIKLKKLKTIWFAGEVFPTKQFNYWRASLTSAMFVNLYGPIEITLDCTYYIVDRLLEDDEPIPIGFPCRNTDILILNENNKLAQLNELGELCVRGSSLAMGYYNDPVKTSEVFVQNPLNNSYPEIIYKTGDIVYKNNKNELIFKGRKDSLVKHLGYRIEMSEIEHGVINTLKIVENACVVYDHKRGRIVLYYESSIEIPVQNIINKISSLFPRYMIPNIFNRMSELPRNVNGKIDRQFLTLKANEE